METRCLSLDKISSTTRNARLSKDVVISDEIISREGYILAVRILNNKYGYDTVEDIGGRMVKLRAGDVVAGVLGYRRALRGYAGVVPESLAVGDTIQVLNLGGVLGICTASNPEIGKPFDAEVLGSILAFPATGDRIGIPACIQSSGIKPSETLAKLPPVIAVAGTCMNAGKTVAATETVRTLNHRGYRVSACKLTGVSLMRDTLSMKDAGALEALNFTDAGVVSTRGGHVIPLVRGLLNHVAKSHPDFIVAELGDGILGEYGVGEILADREIMDAVACHVMCAPDPVAAFGADFIFRNTFGLNIDVMTGPVTDNSVGSDYIKKELGFPAFNARYDIDPLVDCILAACASRR